MSSAGEATARPDGGALEESWIDANQRHLSAALALVRLRLERDQDRPDEAPAIRALRAASAAMPARSALDTISAAFDLTPFETEVLVLCAGVELDSRIAELCAAQSTGAQGHPTFKMALARLPGAHWSALAPAGPLRRFRLIDVGPGHTLTTGPLRIDERILHYLAGIPEMDERLEDHLEVVEAPPELLPSHAALASKLCACWTGTRARRHPSLEIYGPDPHSKREVVAAACARLGLRLYAMTVHALAHAEDGPTLARMLTREATLSQAAILIECEDLGELEGARQVAARRSIERVAAPLVLTRRERGAPLRRGMVAFDMARPTKGEQLALYRSELEAEGARRDPETQLWINRVVAQFDLGPSAIRASCSAARVIAPEGAGAQGKMLWDACRAQARTGLDHLAQRIDSRVSWDDLAVPPPQRRALEEIVVRVRQRMRVHDDWGFGEKSGRGLGIGVLFAGPSGTGKTMAAEVLANELALDLHRIDLSQVVSKYIGDTEKNLRRVFDAAEQGATVLLFDEADALFGKRTEIKDSHDRYANVEVSYLLQRMEAHRGLAILTTNMRAALDQAFLRRLAFVVEFPFPDEAMRAEIWRRVFPAATPTEGIDWQQLARLNLAGGNIRNVALAAAFLAADADEPVRMKHLLPAAAGEYLKLERSLPPELKGRS
jgi:hypothetical protein